MIIVLDIGNTAIKIAIVDAFKVYDVVHTDDHNFIEAFETLFLKYPSLVEVAICQVGKFSDSNRFYINNSFQIFEITSKIKLPFHNKYKSKTLGVDRIALVAGALHAQPKGQGVLVIDAGTCVTYDFLDEHKIYHGGAISPGINIRYHSLHNFTAKLPLLKPKKLKSFIGNTTEKAIHSGVLNGLKQEIKGVVKQYQKKDEKLHVIITGGDGTRLLNALKNRFFASPYLMLHGIYILHRYNTKI